jgi:hypothetical protein
MRTEIKKLNYTMGLNESTIKLINEPIKHLIGTCYHSDCETKCGSCFEIRIDTTHPVVTSLPTLDPQDTSSRSSHESILSNVTLIVERTNEQQ